MNGMRIELCDCENVLLREIECKESTQKGVAMTYAMALCSSENKDRIDWRKVNDAIAARWGQKAILRVKNKAWKLIDEKRKEQANEH